MLVFKELTFKNFKSYGNATSALQFGINRATLIVGEDLDNTSNGRTSNGVGKTTIIDALLYALYDKVLDPDIPVDKLVNNINKKNLEVTVVFERNGINYVVKRYRKTKNGSGVYFEADGQDLTAGSNTSETNKKIVDAIGLPFELFVRIIVFPATQESFLKLPSRSTTKRENQSFIIEELFGYSSLSQKANYLKSVQLKSAEQALAAEEANKTLYERQVADHQRQIENAKRKHVEWDNTRSVNITNIRTQLAEIENVDISQHQMTRELYVDLSGKLQVVGGAILQLEKHIASCQRDLTAANSEIAALEQSTCPYCHQHLQDALERVVTVRTSRDTVASRIEQSVGQLEALREEKQTLTTDVTLIKQAMAATNAERVLELVNQRANMEARVVALEQSTNPYDDVIVELEANPPTPFDPTQLNQLANTVKHRKFLHALLTKKDSFVRKAILDRDLPFLNGRLHYYLEKMGLPHKVEFTPEMTVQITRYGEELSIGNLSAGQKARCNFALSMAFRDVLQSQYGAVNICMMDEVFDVGLDGMGILAAANIVREIAQQENLNVFIISHREEVEAFFQHQLHVKFKEGFSTLMP
jgi:DNA repair exonuclease SbcCD ATPase subunit